MFAEGPEALREYMQIFGAVAFVYDGCTFIVCAKLSPACARNLDRTWLTRKILFPLLRALAGALAC